MQGRRYWVKEYLPTSPSPTWEQTAHKEDPVKNMACRTANHSADGECSRCSRSTAPGGFARSVDVQPRQARPTKQGFRPRLSQSPPPRGITNSILSSPTTLINTILYNGKQRIRCRRRRGRRGRSRPHRSCRSGVSSVECALPPFLLPSVHSRLTDGGQITVKIKRAGRYLRPHPVGFPFPPPPPRIWARGHRRGWAGQLTTPARLRRLLRLWPVKLPERRRIA